MFKKIKIQIESIHSENDKALIETEIDVLEGVKNVDVDEKSGEVLVEFDDSKISQSKLFETIQKLGFSVLEETKEDFLVAREHTYFVQGMHCASCEVLIEKKLLSLREVKSVEASIDKGKVLIEYKNQRLNIHKLNELFRGDGYSFSDRPFKVDLSQEKENNNYFSIIVTAIIFIIGFFLLKNSGFSDLINVSSTSSLSAFFFLGILAGFSSCAALVGGIVLSMSKQWLGMYSEKNSFSKKFQPHLMFNAGRLASYTILGGLLGVIGEKLQLSLGFASLLTIAVSVMMIFLALQMLGVGTFRKFQITVPRFITRYIADETNFQAKYTPAIMGALTFFLPCGFSLTAQGLALVSGNPIQGALIMFSFALGTLPALMVIGMSAVKFSQKPHSSYKFLKVGGILVLFFALYNVNAQMNVLGYPSFSDIRFGSNTSQSNSNWTLNNGNNNGSTGVGNNNNGAEGLPLLVNGKQVIKMNASSSGFKPNYFKIKTGVPVRWEITDIGTSGCTNAVISNGLFAGDIKLTPGTTSVKEFTPTKVGKYKFSCWMGMVSGVFEVVDGGPSVNSADSQNSGANALGLNAVALDADGAIPSGAKGCGCGGGGGASCGAR